MKSVVAASLWLAGLSLCGDGAEIGVASPQTGLNLLRNKVYMPAELTRAEWDGLWEFWPDEQRQLAQSADLAERRRMTYSYYGLMPRPEGDSGLDAPPLSHVDDGTGNWSTNCLVCHGGKVAGKQIPGLANSHIAYQSLLEDVLKVRRAAGKNVARQAAALALAPMNRTDGVTNAQVFSVALVAMRDPQLNFVPPSKLPPLRHHDLDAPPLWNTRRKRMLYIDGFVEKSPRVLMQFVLVPGNDGSTVRGWEEDFRHVLAWIESLEPPKYPWEINAELARAGKTHFDQHCADCHGTYGDKPFYPERTIPIDEIGTDSLRLRGMSSTHRRFFSESWFNHGDLKVIAEPEGYVAPPLDGIWASAPYFHNGSVPTLWHVLHPAERPQVWRRTEDGYDTERVGLEVETVEAVPRDAKTPAQRRRYFDSSKPGKSAAGHDYPDALSESEKRAVLEYLKTL